MMRDLLSAIFGGVFSWWGLTLISVLDSSILFFLPLAIDLGVIIMSARTRNLFWAYAILATGGSLVGSASTYMMGKRHLTPTRLLRFSTEAVLAYFYGRKIVALLESQVVKDVGIALIVLMVTGSIVTIVRTLRRVARTR